MANELPKCEKKKQLRGKDLEQHIKDGIKKLATEAVGKYTYNASRLSEAIDVSRPTLLRHSGIIDQVLKDLAASRRLENGQGAIQFLQEKVQRQASEIVSLKQERDLLRNHHAEIYLRIYHHATDLEHLVRPIAEKEIFEADRCILCNHPTEEIPPPQPSKVIQLHKQRTDKFGNPKK